MSNRDMLDHLFELQATFNQRIGVDPTTMDQQQRTEWLLNYTRALSQETAELIDSVPWKWWAKYQEFDLQNARVEAVDLLHFLISICQVLDMSAEDVYQLYLKKNKVNIQRQDTGYATKDEDDNRHLDL